MSHPTHQHATNRWLLVTTSPPPNAASTLRVFLWRNLRALGALYLQQSVCLLPDRSEVAGRLARIVTRVRAEGGEVRILHLLIDNRTEEQSVIEAFQAQRTDEYREVCARAPAFLEEIAMERARGRATYTEVEESEVDLERLRGWLAKIRGRDYFDAPGRSEAEAAVEECARALAAFEREALANDAPELATPHDPLPQAGRTLRTVDQ